jgi:hypothetical protein
MLCVLVLWHAYQMLFLAELKKTSASWNSEILQSVRVLPF